MSLPYDNKMIECAKRLRKNATSQENHLWYDFLRSYPIRFQRQKAISGFVADFYCHKARLIIEIDGSQHYEDKGKIYDDKRTAALEEFGLKVLRFSNEDVDRNFYSVCECIDRTIGERISEA